MSSSSGITGEVAAARKSQERTTSEPRWQDVSSRAREAIQPTFSVLSTSS